MRGHWFVALVAGCGFKVNNTPFDASSTDAVDAAGTMTCPWPYTPSGFDPCSGVPAETLPDLDLSTPGVYLYDTGDGTLTPPAPAADLMVPSTGSGGARVIWTKSFRIGADATLRVTGGDPLIVVSQSTVTIDGTLDVGSHLLGNDRVGAGSNPAGCAAATLNGTQCSHGGSGGGGGGFGTAGWLGGVGGLTHDCGAGSQAGIAGGPGGAASADPGFRGGCNGGDGADGDGSGGGAGGDGGGAVHVAARDTLRVSSTGQVLAGGGGGTGGQQRAIRWWRRWQRRSDPARGHVDHRVGCDRGERRGWRWRRERRSGRRWWRRTTLARPGDRRAARGSERYGRQWCRGRSRGHRGNRGRTRRRRRRWRRRQDPADHEAG